MEKLYGCLSEEPWSAQTDFAFKSEDGKTIGFPYAVEGYGITYNADILKKAEIDPNTLTNYDAHKDAFEKEMVTLKSCLLDLP